MVSPPTLKKECATVAVGMSGGVDSAVTAWLLKEQGYAVVGLTMSIWDSTRPSGIASRQSACYGPGEAEDITSAREIAEHLGFPHVTVPLAHEYEQEVLDEFLSRHLAGYTPNPCAICNPKMKFGFLVARAREQGVHFDYFATGHYARIARDASTGFSRLLRGIDATKDQSYFLARLTQTQLVQTLFPLGEKTKREVRALACRAGLKKLAEKRESQDFFEGDDIAILFGRKTIQPGPIVDEAGTVLGRHRGLIYYTVGQREGLGIAVGRKVYVKAIHVGTNTLVVAAREDVFAKGCSLSDVQWIAGRVPDTDRNISIQLRYRHSGVPAQIEYGAEGGANIRFAAPQFAVTPGQMAVLYDGEEILGSGWIEKPNTHAVFHG